MWIDCYLVVKKPKDRVARPSIRLTKNAPSLDARERAVRIELSMPDALWDQPQLKAEITVPDSAVSKPVIEAEVLDNIQEVLSQQLGVDLNISVVEKSEPA